MNHIFEKEIQTSFGNNLNKFKKKSNLYTPTIYEYLMQIPFKKLARELKLFAFSFAD